MTRFSRERLEAMLGAARAKHDLTKRGLARALGRDPSKLLPTSGIPKIDFVVRLAELLDWPVDEVIRQAIAPTPETGAGAAPKSTSFRALEAEAATAHAAGRAEDVIACARQAFSAARTAEERLAAANREIAGWDALGRFDRVIRRARAALRDDVTPDLSRVVVANMGIAYSARWELAEAAGLGLGVLSDLAGAPESPDVRLAAATAHYLVGHALRRMALSADAETRPRAVRHLSEAEARFAALAGRYDVPSYGAIAQTCAGALVELRTLDGRMDPDDALAFFEANIASSEALDGLDADPLETQGWWCVFACNIAHAVLTNPGQRQKTLAVFTNKADEIAERLGAWTIRERVLSFDFEHAHALTDTVLDEDDIRTITGAMGRFPTFRARGWQLLRAARLVEPGRRRGQASEAAPAPVDRRWATTT